MLSCIEESVDYLAGDQADQASSSNVFIDEAKTMVTKEFAKKYLKVACRIK